MPQVAMKLTLKSSIWTFGALCRLSALFLASNLEHNPKKTYLSPRTNEYFHRQKVNGFSPPFHGRQKRLPKTTFQKSSFRSSWCSRGRVWKALKKSVDFRVSGEKTIVGCVSDVFFLHPTNVNYQSPLNHRSFRDVANFFQQFWGTQL